eukprot:6201758-Pleurochrysis_carterae.AAC.1
MARTLAPHARQCFNARLYHACAHVHTQACAHSCAHSCARACTHACAQDCVPLAETDGNRKYYSWRSVENDIFNDYSQPQEDVLPSCSRCKSALASVQVRAS